MDANQYRDPDADRARGIFGTAAVVTFAIGSFCQIAKKTICSRETLFNTFLQMYWGGPRDCYLGRYPLGSASAVEVTATYKTVVRHASCPSSVESSAS